MNDQRLLVMKFGGTSVGQAARFRECAAIIRQASCRDRVIVVVSAMAGVTDLIFRIIDAARHGDTVVAEAQLHKFESVHKELMTQLLDGNRQTGALEFLSGVFTRLEDSVRALLALRSAISPETTDSLVALGERLSAWVLASYLEQLGSASQFVRAEEAIVTNNNFGNAAPDRAATRESCRRVLFPILDRGAVPVVAGYSGATQDGRTTTLGRGGTDYSATIIGAAVDAAEVWIWTDVDGVLTADPRVCPEATTLPEISFAEAIELAYYGAKVIHPKAAYPAAEAGFPVWIKNSFRPEVAGTRITSTPHSIHSPVKSVTCVKNAVLLTLVSRHDIHPMELWGRLFLRLGQEQIETLFATQSSPEHALGLVLRQEDSAHVMQLINSTFRLELAQGVLNPVAVSDVAVVAVLGESMKGTSGILGRAFSAVALRQVSVIAVAQGASELSICFAVPARSATEVVQAIHNEFFAKDDVAVPVCLRPNLAPAPSAQ
jgi:aspartate kinase